ncbi:hypothetical protein GCM10022205_40490 [Spinactinospora alkalitolerans]
MRDGGKGRHRAKEPPQFPWPTLTGRTVEKASQHYCLIWLAARGDHSGDDVTQGIDPLHGDTELRPDPGGLGPPSLPLEASPSLSLREHGRLVARTRTIRFWGMGLLHDGNHRTLAFLAPRYV